MAVELGLATDGGLFIPEELRPLSTPFWESLHTYSYPDIVWNMMYPFFGDGLSAASFQRVVDRVCTIPIHLVAVEDRWIAELFHGPTLAFKDIGASWMAGLLGEYQQHEDQELHILVATSGDTGGAVAAAFHQVDGIRVHILYPKGKVSELQERQIAGLGGNIQSLAIDGTFDDCQTLVKKAFLDPALRQVLRMTSANSINVARWIPQSISYIESYRQCTHYPEKRSFVVPCGNLGNLSAGLFAEALGLPIGSWVASTNENDSFVQFLHHGHSESKPLVSTLAHAMDVGNPNNLDRVSILQCSTWNISPKPMRGYCISDSDIQNCIQTVYNNHGYILDPHTATAWSALDMDHKMNLHPHQTILMATAHPSKFIELMNRILGLSGNTPHAKQSGPYNHHQLLPQNYPMFKDYLLSWRQ